MNALICGHAFRNERLENRAFTFRFLFVIELNCCRSFQTFASRFQTSRENVVNIDGFGAWREYFVFDRFAHFPRDVLNFLRANVWRAMSNGCSIIQPTVTKINSGKDVRSVWHFLVIDGILVEETTQSIDFGRISRGNADFHIANRIETHPKALQMRNENNRIADFRQNKRFHFAVRRFLQLINGEMIAIQSQRQIGVENDFDSANDIVDDDLFRAYEISSRAIFLH